MNRHASMVPSRLGRLGLLVATLGLGLAPAACSDAAEGEAGTTAEGAFTVANGHRFVVSATPDEIVLRKSVNGVAFPFDEEALRGKAVLIHPVADRAAKGVYVRATEVESRDDRYVVTGEPLSLREMEELTEDDVVRIYIDPKRAPDASTAPQLEPSAFFQTGQLRPLGFSGIAFEGFDTSAGWGLSQPAFVQPGISFSHKVATADFSPDVLFEWSREEGLEVGFKGKLAWKSSLTVSGRVSGELFRSKTYESPWFIRTVMIGIAPVPIAFYATATVTCNAGLSGILESTVTVETSAELGGSVRVQPSRETSPTEWVKEGRWPATADGTASATLGTSPKLGASITCNVPRTELKAFVGGAAGPYLAVTPTVGVNESGAVLEGKVAAGVGAGMLGIGTGVELNLYTWKP